MKMRKINREYKLSLNNNLDIKYGFPNIDNKKVIYVSLKGWIEPHDYEDVSICGENIDNIIKKFKRNFRNLIVSSKCFENKIIYDFDYNTLSFNNNKRNYICGEIFLKSDEIKYFSIKEMKQKMTKLLKPIIDDFTKELIINNFNFFKTKQ